MVFRVTARVVDHSLQNSNLPTPRSGTKPQRTFNTVGGVDHSAKGSTSREDTELVAE
jgi:hypothetical protein